MFLQIIKDPRIFENEQKKLYKKQSASSCLAARVVGHRDLDCVFIFIG